MRRQLIGFILAVAAAAMPWQARAGIPVIDMAAVANLIQQLGAWQQQLSGMQRQYEQLTQSNAQLQQTYSAMTGARGMEQLLPTADTARNYLPSSYGELMNTVNATSGGYCGPVGTDPVDHARQQHPLENADERAESGDAAGRRARPPGFRHVQRHEPGGLPEHQPALLRVAAAGRSDRDGPRDPKAIQDLQARIQAEQNMLTNEQTKLQGLYEIARSEKLAQQQRIRERAISDVGTIRSNSTVTY